MQYNCILINLTQLPSYPNFLFYKLPAAALQMWGKQKVYVCYSEDSVMSWSSGDARSQPVTITTLRFINTKCEQSLVKTITI